MKKHTRLNAIRVLKKVRDKYHSQLDTRVVTELNDLIVNLKSVNDEKQDTDKLVGMSLRSLQVIGLVVNLVCNFKNLTK